MISNLSVFNENEELVALLVFDQNPKYKEIKVRCRSLTVSTIISRLQEMGSFPYQRLNNSKIIGSKGDVEITIDYDNLRVYISEGPEHSYYEFMFEKISKWKPL